MIQTSHWHYLKSRFSYITFLHLAFFVLLYQWVGSQTTDLGPTGIAHSLKSEICGAAVHPHLPQFEHHYTKNLESNSFHRKMEGLYTIPVVIHIIHSGQALGTDSNPLDDEVIRIVQETGDRFRHTHINARTYENPHYGVDTEIDFCLTKEDEDGKIVNGINRYHNSSLSRGEYNDNEWVKRIIEKYRWDPKRFLNVFVVENLDAAGVFLGGSNDIIIISAGVFWSGLLTHEIGHYFGLDHIFAPDQTEKCPDNNNCLEQGDRVCDTPPKAKAGYAGADGCNQPANSCHADDDDESNSNPYRPVEKGGMGDQPDMLENYMDYTGGCWDAFTKGQSVRMRTYIESFRPELMTPRCGEEMITAVSQNNNLRVKIYPNPTSGITTIEAPSLVDFSIRVYDAMGTSLLQSRGQVQIDLAHLSDGIYLMEVMEMSSGKRSLKRITKVK